MRSGDVALRFSIVFAVAGFITMAAGIWEIDRREKSSSETVTSNLTQVEQRVRILSDLLRLGSAVARELERVSRNGLMPAANNKFIRSPRRCGRAALGAPEAECLGVLRLIRSSNLSGRGGRSAVK
jgi:hypothetical protein